MTTMTTVTKDEDQDEEGEEKSFISHSNGGVHPCFIGLFISNRMTYLSLDGLTGHRYGHSASETYGDTTRTAWSVGCLC